MNSGKGPRNVIDCGHMVSVKLDDMLNKCKKWTKHYKVGFESFNQSIKGILSMSLLARFLLQSFLRVCQPCACYCLCSSDKNSRHDSSCSACHPYFPKPYLEAICKSIPHVCSTRQDPAPLAADKIQTETESPHSLSLPHAKSTMSQLEKPKAEPIKYGDVFEVSGELASQAIPPGDASTVQAAENLVMGQTFRGGPAATMQSAARKNLQTGHVDRGQVTDIAKQEGVSVSSTDVQGHRIVTEAIGGEVLGQYVRPEPVENNEMKSPASALDRDVITIGEALEVTTMSAGDKVVDQSDAAAIQAAEARATGSNTVTPGGVAAMAQSAVTLNERIVAEDQKITLSDVLTDAARKLPGDRAVTREDAEGVIGAEIRNSPNLSTYPGGVAASMATAARHNQT